MAFMDLAKLFYRGVERVREPNHHDTKAGPGRRNARRTVGAKRLETRTTGGNWQGQEYLSYREHDVCVRSSLHEHDRLVRASSYLDAAAAVHEART